MMALEDSVNPMQGISGPGSFSKRTDLEYQSPEYGAGVQYDANKAAAPLAKTPDVRGATTTAVQDAASQAITTKPVGLFETSQNTNPITAGLDRGPGPGSEALGMNKISVKTSDTLAKLLPFDTTGDIAVLYQEAIARGD
jgi:hypothetical protein